MIIYESNSLKWKWWLLNSEAEEISRIDKCYWCEFLIFGTLIKVSLSESIYCHVSNIRSVKFLITRRSNRLLNFCFSCSSGFYFSFNVFTALPKIVSNHFRRKDFCFSPAEKLVIEEINCCLLTRQIGAFY